MPAPTSTAAPPPRVLHQAKLVFRSTLSVVSRSSTISAAMMNTPVIDLGEGGDKSSQSTCLPERERLHQQQGAASCCLQPSLMCAQRHFQPGAPPAKR
ncbi:MAG: hypothetical protein SGPRY_014622, partial [Prymnesium sp.]